LTSDYETTTRRFIIILDSYSFCCLFVKKNKLLMPLVADIVDIERILPQQPIGAIPGYPGHGGCCQINAGRSPFWTRPKRTEENLN